MEGHRHHKIHLDMAAPSRKQKARDFEDSVQSIADMKGEDVDRLLKELKDIGSKQRTSKTGQRQPNNLHCYGTNHKRARTPPSSNHLEILSRSLPFHEHNKLSRRQRTRNEESNKTQSIRSRSFSPRCRNANLTEKHAASEMSGKSPGKQSRHQQSSSPNETRPYHLRSSPPAGLETQESADSYANEGEVIEAKRVKPNAAGGLKQQHNSKLPIYISESDNSAEDGAQPGLLMISREGPAAYADAGHAREHKDLYETKDAPKNKKSPWRGEDRYHNSQTNSLPDYGKPQGFISVAAKQQEAKEMSSSLGAFLPRNTLNKGNKSGTLDRPNASTPINGFDLHQNEYPRHYSLPNKRQRTGGSMGQSSPSEMAIDLESETIRSQQPAVLHTARSGQSQVQNGSRKGSNHILVKEYRAVVDSINLKRQRKVNLQQASSSSDGLAMERSAKPRSNSSSQANRQTAVKGYPALSLSNEDPTDPVELSEDEVAITQNKSTSCKRTANNWLPRQLKNEASARRSLALSQGTSQYFSQTRDLPQMKSSAYQEFDSDLRRISQQNARPLKRNASSGSAPYEDEDSIDELAKSHSRTAQDLLNQHRHSKDQLSKGNKDIMKSFAGPSPSVETKGDIHSTNFTGFLQKPKGKKSPTENLYTVVQIFSPGHIWLLPSSKTSWTLREDCTTGALTVFNSEEKKVSDLFLMPKLIHKLAWNSGSAKLAIFKAMDSTLYATKIFLELQNVDESVSFVDSVKARDCSIGLIDRGKNYLDKIFAQQFQIASERLVKEPEDIELLRRREELKRAREWEAQQNAKRIRPSLVDDSDDHDAAPAPKRKSLMREMKTRSSSDLEDPVLSIPPGNFYRTDLRNPQPANAYFHETRSSTRIADTLSKPEPIQRSPSPERWTQVHKGWDKDWVSSVIYPREGKGKATVDKRDIDRLDEGEFLNDNLIIFYLRWLEHHLEQDSPELAKRIYFHNTFFYASLTRPEKGRRGINYKAVQRWTAKIDLPAFDYIIVPVCENTHWYVAIICNAPKLLHPEPKHKDTPPPEDMQNCDDPEPHEVNDSSTPVAGPLENEMNGTTKDIEQLSLHDKPLRRDNLKEDDEWPNDDAANPVPPVQSSIKVTSESPKAALADPYTEMSDPFAAVTATADNMHTSVVKSSPKRGKRKSIIPAPRKYDPKEPRIITLDSLGSSHSPTCSNLKEYIIAEIKSRHGIEIPPPGAIGMTAKNIPYQDNYCDCGLFLLVYIEKFLEHPDEFVRSILQKEVDVDMHWRKAPEMRSHIREILLKLQKDQVVEAKKLEQERIRAKRVAKLEKAEATEAEEGIRNSATIRKSKEKPHTSTRPVVEIPVKISPMDSTIIRMVFDDVPEVSTAKESQHKGKGGHAQFKDSILKPLDIKTRDEDEGRSARVGRSKSNAVDLEASPERCESPPYSQNSPLAVEIARLKPATQESLYSPRFKGRQRSPTPYPRNVPRSESREPSVESVYSVWKGIPESPKTEAVNEESHSDDSIHLIKPLQNRKVIPSNDDDENPQSDDDMLLQNESTGGVSESFPRIPKMLSSPTEQRLSSPASKRHSLPDAEELSSSRPSRQHRGHEDDSLMGRQVMHTPSPKGKNKHTVRNEPRRHSGSSDIVVRDGLDRGLILGVSRRRS